MILNDANVCACGRWKSSRASVCRECNDMMRSVREEKKDWSYKYDTCVCGNKKLKVSKRCSDCWQSWISVDDVHCIDCGGDVKNRKSKRCVPCSQKHNAALWAERNRQLNDTCECGKSKRKKNEKCWYCTQKARGKVERARLARNLEKIGATWDGSTKKTGFRSGNDNAPATGAGD